MIHSFRFFFTQFSWRAGHGLPLAAVAALALFPASGQETQRPQMTARELFYNAGAAPAAKPSPKAPQRTVAKKPSPAPVTQQASNNPPHSSAPAATPAAPAASDGTKIIMVSDGSRATAPPPATGTALGLKYTILKLTGDSMTPAAPSTVFHAHDKIQFSVETNGPGYLYIVGQGSSGTWRPMFPSPEIAGGDNKVEGFHTYVFPFGYRYVFDTQAGDEKVFIVFSRELKPDFEQLVYSLQGGATHPVSQPGAQERPKPQLRASIDDSAVDKLHKTYARDLVIERVGDDPHPAADNSTQEKAVYVVNASGSPDSALVAVVQMVHQ